MRRETTTPSARQFQRRVTSNRLIATWHVTGACVSGWTSLAGFVKQKHLPAFATQFDVSGSSARRLRHCYKATLRASHLRRYLCAPLKLLQQYVLSNVSRFSCSLIHQRGLLRSQQSLHYASPPWVACLLVQSLTYRPVPYPDPQNLYSEFPDTDPKSIRPTNKHGLTPRVLVCIFAPSHQPRSHMSYKFT